MRVEAGNESGWRAEVLQRADTVTFVRIRRGGLQNVNVKAE